MPFYWGISGRICFHYR